MHAALIKVVVENLCNVVHVLDDLQRAEALSMWRACGLHSVEISDGQCER